MSVRNHIAASAAVLICVTAAMARADHRPVIAVPGNAQAPVIINGADASFAVANGDWGLYAPGRVVPEIYGPVLVYPDPADRGYFPATGRRPRYGRQEVNVPRRVLPRAPDFYREWSTGSRAGRVTEYPPYAAPEVMVEPRSRDSECTGNDCPRPDRRSKRRRGYSR
jgi:hypothetical protein